MDETLVCIVCSGQVGPDAPTCPKCGEPRMRLCHCAAFVTLAHRECPNCGRVIPRLISMQERSRRRWRRRWWIAGAALVVAAGAGAVAWPRVRAARHATDLLAAGAADLAAGHAADAARTLADYVALRPADARGMHLLATALLASGDTSGGRVWAERALAADPASPGTHLLLARHYLAEADPQAALAHATEAAEPDAPAVAGLALAALGRDVAAAERFDAAVAAAPDDLATRLEAAAVHARLGAADWVGAAAHRARAAELDRETAEKARAVAAAHGGDATGADAAHALAQALARLDRGAEAYDACRRALALRDDADTRIAWASAAERAADPVALAEFNEAIGDAPPPGAAASVRQARARILVASGRIDVAISELRAALASDAGDLGAAVALADVLTATGSPDEALAVVTAARAAGNAGSPALLRAAAEAARARGDVVAAERFAVAWRGASPRDPLPLRMLLDLRMPDVIARRTAAEEPDETTRAAVNRLAELAALDADDPALLYWRCRWDDANGRSDAADRDLARLLELHPDHVAGRALRIQRAFAGAGTLVSPLALADEVEDPSRATDSDVRTFAEASLESGRADLALDVATGPRRETSADAALRAVEVRALLAMDLPQAAADALGPGIGVPLALRAAALALAGRRDEAAALASDASAADVLAVARALAAADDVPRARSLITGEDLSAAGPQALAVAYDTLGMTDEARAAWADAERATPSDIRLLGRSATATLLRPGVDETDRALAAQRVELLRSRPEAASEALALRGLFALADGEADLAAADLRRVVAVRPDRDDLRRALALADARAGRFGAAAAGLRVVLRHDPADRDARDALRAVLLRSAASDLDAGRILGALRWIDEAGALASGRAERAPRTPSMRPLSDAALAYVRRRSESADEGRGMTLLLAFDAVAREPSSDAGRALAAGVSERAAESAGGPALEVIALAAAGRTQDAAGALARAVERGLPPADATFLGASLAGAVPGDAALDALRSAAETTPESPRLRAALAESLVARGDTDAALRAFADLLADAPDEAFAAGLHAWGARLADAARRQPAWVPAARRALRRALATSPGSPSAAASRAALASLAAAR